MSFFFADAARTAPRRPVAARGPIPIATLEKMGCKACPRDGYADILKHPKLTPTGRSDALVYLLGPEVSNEEDVADAHWVHRYGKVLLDKFPDRMVTGDMRFGHIVQCGDTAINALTRAGKDLDPHASACCRRRVVDDIEATRPVVVVGVGDAALRWATGIGGGSLTRDKKPGTPLGGGAMTWRGRFMAVQFGKHACWYFQLAWPNFVASKRKHKGEHELTLEHDIAALTAFLSINPQLPEVWRSGYDDGILLIDGHAGISDLDKLQQALNLSAAAVQSGLDIETNGLRPYMRDPRIWTAAVGTFETSVAFPLDHPDGWRNDRHKREAWGMFGEYLLHSGTKICHHLGFEQEWLGHFYGMDLLRRTSWGDSMAMAHTLDERKGTRSLEAQTVVEFGFNLKDQSPVDVKRPDWVKQYQIMETLRYNGMDTKWCDMLARTLEVRLKADDPLQWEQYERKVRAAPALVMMQALGMHADITRATDLERTYADKAAVLSKMIQETPEARRYERKKQRRLEPGNPDSVLDMMKWLDRPEIQREQREGGVKWTTDEEALAAMPVGEVPSAPMILELRGVEKLRSTYLGPVLSGKLTSDDGLLHTSYSQFTAVSSRLSAEDPAVQNWPKRKYREIRGVITTPDGDLFVSCDLGQIEFRVVGMCSEDDQLVRACWTDYDVHSHWAQRMVDVWPATKDWIVREFGVDWDEKGLKTLRQESKNGWVFPQFFGASLNSIGPRMHLPSDVAEKLDAEFWDTFAATKRWQNKLMKQYDRSGYVETLDGHRRRGPMTRNEIINHPIQGTAARINIDACCALSELAQLTSDMEIHPVLNVHDDLTERMSERSVAEKSLIIAQEMCRIRHPWVNVPILVEVSIGKRWDELKEIAKYRSDALFGHRNPYAKESRRG